LAAPLAVPGRLSRAALIAALKAKPPNKIRRGIMKLLTAELERKLLANGRAQATVRGTEDEHNFQPVVKLFTPDANATWLLTELDTDDPQGSLL
jgi:hypothetical protein